MNRNNLIKITALSAFLLNGCGSSNSDKNTTNESISNQNNTFKSECTVLPSGLTPLTFQVKKEKVEVNGVSCDGSPEAFNLMYKSNPQIKSLYLGDIEGSVDDTANLELGNLIRDKGLDTTVDAKSHITSGGVDLFASGLKRNWSSGAKIGVHSWSDGTKDGSSYPKDDASHTMYIEFYKKMGISPDFYWFTLNAAPSNGMHYMTDDEVAKYLLQSASNESSSINAIPKELAKTYTPALGFDKYAYVSTPNGGKIHIIAQDKINESQLMRSKAILEHFLRNFEGSKFGADKSMVANKMAENNAILMLLNGQDDGKNPAKELDGQPLYQNEIQVEGHEWYLKQDYTHRDAAYEEILHLVHDYGIGVDKNPTFIGAAKDFQTEIRLAQENAIADKLWGRGDENQAWLEELRGENSLSQEYLAAVIDSYYGLWGSWQAPKKEDEGGMWGIYAAKTRDDIKTKDTNGWNLMGQFFHPYLTYNAQIHDSFKGDFSLRFDAKKPYTNHSRYLKDITLTGSNNANVVVNELNNTIVGNSGDNAVIFSGEEANYVVEQGQDGWHTITDSRDNGDGIVKVKNIEKLKFLSTEVNLK